MEMNMCAKHFFNQGKGFFSEV